MNKNKLLVSLSLPKTGTTYLQSLLSQVDNVCYSKIKEPSYFYKQKKSNNAILRSLLARGNYARGLEWYESHFICNDSNGIFIDMSTQYWMHCNEVIENVREIYNPVFIVINRNKNEQLLSYITHLRRGHIPDKKIEDLYNKNIEFARFLNNMSQWTDNYKDLIIDYSKLDIIEISFDKLIKKPLETISNMPLNYSGVDNIALDVEKNVKGSPNIPYVNKLLFSEPLKMIGRSLPNAVYAKLINARKMIIRKNLTRINDKIYNEDKEFVIKYFS